ncbi:hypothetical protein ACI65C_013809 [Semiaphis heraclei]
MKENKVSIFKPRKDQCDLCSAYENFQVSEEEYAMHIALKNSAREEKQKDKKNAEVKKPGIGKGEPEVKDIRELLYDPSTSCIYFKLLFDDPYCAIPKKVFPRKKTIRIDEDQQFQYKPLYKKPLNLSLSKWNDLQKLKPVLPIDTHSFYDTLLHCNELKTKKALDDPGEGTGEISEELGVE